jgi:NitT/TauT family transport system substrate-binding protein
LDRGKSVLNGRRKTNKEDTKMKRRNVAAILLIVFLILTANAHGARKLNFIYSSIHIGYLPRIIALEKGFFKAEGLDVTATDIPGGPKAMAAVIGGSAEVGNLAYFHVMKAIQKGSDLVAFACPLNQWPMAYLMKPDMMQKKGITAQSSLDDKIKAMKGLKIGMTSPGSGTDVIPRAFLKNRGMDPDKDVYMVPFGPVGAGIAAFEQGKIDIFQWSSPIPEMLESKGIGKVIFNMSKGDIPEFNGYMWDSYFTTRNYLKENRETVLAFTRAIMKAINYIYEDRKGTMEVMKKTFPEATPELIEKSYQNILPAIPRKPVLTRPGHDINLRLYFADLPKEEMNKIAFEIASTNEIVEKAAEELRMK